MLVARRRDRLEKSAREMTSEHRISCEALEADLSQAEAVAAVEKRLQRGDITLLVNCAGFGTQGPFAGLPLEKELQEIEVNVRALTRLSHAVLEAMVPKKRGTIINVAGTRARVSDQEPTRHDRRTVLAAPCEWHPSRGLGAGRGTHLRAEGEEYLGGWAPASR